MASVTLGAPGGLSEPAPILVLGNLLQELDNQKSVNTVKIDDKAWPITGSISWGYRSGVQPQAVSVQMQTRFARNFALKSKRGATTIKMIVSELTGGAGETINERKNTIEFEKLNMQLRLPSDYARNVLTIEDDRYRWNRERIFRDFNVTRKANDIIIFTDLPGSRENLLRESRVLYRERTLKDDGTPWTALDIVRYCLIDILGYDPKDVDTTTASSSPYVPPNERIDGEDAASLISRMMTLDGNDLLIDEKGKVIVYDRTAPFTEADFRRLFPQGVVGRLGGAMHLMDYETIRPQHIEHLVTPKIEMLFTFEQRDARSTGSGVAKSFAEARAQMLTGQVAVSNVTRTVIDGQAVNEKGESVPRGTVISIDKALEGFGTLYGQNAITTDDLLQFYGADAFLITGAVLGANLIDPTAAIVKDAIEKDFRQLFQVPRFVIEQIRGMEALHADMLNTVTRTRAPSSVFSTISWLVPSSVMLPKDMPDGVVLDSFTETNQQTGQRTRRQKYAPISGARVTIEDEELGLIRIDWGQDFDRPGAVKSVVPGEANDGGYYLRQDTNYSYNSKESFAGTGLKTSWECSFVLSVIPDLYEDQRRFYREVRTPPAMTTQGGAVIAVKGRGPRLQRRIRVEDARFTHGIAPYELGPVDNTTNPSALALGARGRFVNEAVVDALITEENLRIYKTFNDQIEGTMTLFPGKRNIKIRPQGSLRSIIYTYATNGLVSINLSASRYTTPANILSRLPADVLKATFRQLDPPTQGG